MDSIIDNLKDIQNFEIPKETPQIIKVIGVGGGGGNAVNHMYKQGIKDVTFALCNTDNQALNESPIPVKLQLGKETTMGLGAGNKPEKAKLAAEESIDDIKKLLDDMTRMVFITAGMGGGTGTGAAPVIAKIAKDMGILTIGIVTIPFLFEGEKKIIQALNGVEQLAKNVDALLVINNERLREIHSDLTLVTAFAKADDTLSIAAKSIAELITKEGVINVDFADVNTILKDGGVAIMSTGEGKGKNRLSEGIKSALHSPLLNKNDIFNAKKVLFNIYCSEAVKMEEFDEVDEFMRQFGDEVEVIWGMSIEQELGDDIRITILATGFGVECVPGMDEHIEKRSKEEINNHLKKEEKIKQKRKELIEAAYGESAKKWNRLRENKNHIYLFSIDDLDNDHIISLVEDTPTYQRTKNKLEIIKNSRDTDTYNTSNNEESQETSAIIKF